MPILAGALYRDSFNFMRNQFISIVIICLLVSVIAFLLLRGLSPDLEAIQALMAEFVKLATGVEAGTNQQMALAQFPENQRAVLMKLAFSITATTLIEMTLLAGGIISLVSLISQNQKNGVLEAITKSLPKLPGLLIFFVVMSLLTLLIVFISLLLCSVIFSILKVAGTSVAFLSFLLLSFMFFSAVGISLFSLSPTLLLTENLTVLNAMRQSLQKTKSQLRLVMPGIFSVLIVSRFFFTSSPLTPPLQAVFMHTLNNLLIAFILIYLFRLYMCLSPKAKSLE